jgi:polysaccharide deacetylase family protein (PEP-CTERM system associated)
MQLAKTFEISRRLWTQAPEQRALPGMEYWCAPRTPETIVNALTIDLEDWPIAVLDPDHEVTGRVVENTLRCLQILRWHNVKATFFALTKVAEKHGDLIKEVHTAGHEIASHGHSHELLTRTTPRRFETDLLRSIDILACLTNRRPAGYRAPGFSIVQSTRWAGPILARHGFRYSSSIFPIHHRRYGIPDAPPWIHRWKDCDLIECPPATLRALGQNWPVAGGGYFRLLPGAVARFAIRRINRANLPAILYLHPYELDVDGVGFHKLQGTRVGPWRHLTQALFRSRMETRLHRLLEGFRFTTVDDLLRDAL